MATVEISGSIPYIDFHFGNANVDYTSRIIESSAGVIEVLGELRVYGRRLLCVDESPGHSIGGIGFDSKGLYITIDGTKYGLTYTNR